MFFTRLLPTLNVKTSFRTNDLTTETDKEQSDGGLPTVGVWFNNIFGQTHRTGF